ncbi:MAG: F0F1 ATP synthase subunit delta [Woeseiaceae bacterium]
MADNNTLARPYAQALFELASDASARSEWAGALAALAPIGADAGFQEFAANPRMGERQILEAIQSFAADIPGAGTFAAKGGEAENFLRLLIENDRLEVLPEIAERFVALKDAAENSVDVTITTASSVNAKEQAQITGALKSRLGREVNVTMAINEDLIGGAVVRAGDFVIDGSVRSQLDKMSAVLSK